MIDKNNRQIIPVIISGGIGKRLWPLSRESCPKPYLKLYNAKSLLQNTVIRCKQIPFLANPIIISNTKSKFITLSQLREIGAEDSMIILEPECHNTAPSIAVAAHYVKQMIGGEALLLIMPVDHKMDNTDGLIRSIQMATMAAERGDMVIFGIEPTSVQIGYGYIEVKSTTPCDGVYQVEAFVEKPNEARAAKFIDDGHYFWNAGIYFIQAERLIIDFKKQQPMMYSECGNALLASHKKDNIIELPSNAYLCCPSISVDHAITENTSNIVMVELHTDWQDIGGWKSLYELEHKDENRNVISGNVVTLDTKNSYIQTENNQLILALGMNDCTIVQTRDAVLLANNKYLDKLPNILDTMRKDDRAEVTTASTVFRPWGFYTLIETTANFQIKKIVVNPHQSLSLQEHQYRSEHWIILKGKATVTLGHDIFVISHNESVFVPIGTKHRLQNNEASPLEIIEIQTGSYLGEDDIIRYEDMYEREKMSE